MAKAAIRSHAPSLYSLAVIQFSRAEVKNDKDLRAGVALCARAAFLGHVDALRELGHCLQDGYGVPQKVSEGRRFLVQANARELAAVLSSGIKARSWLQPQISNLTKAMKGNSLGDGVEVVFSRRMWTAGDEKHEFRRCSVCGVVNYCSRACQALDWKLRHKVDCAPMEQDAADDGGGNVPD
ncbi:hypothetical protein Bca52824_024274 [Brassica carinata]|uniref:MYND-type domain-containing protein n=1 Tax=Brassica carinata TaxID=52824 RepID=A0A8X8AWK2_BRACI|nr:hypothetical protein Bca52824_024274 [Brassica carinata]